MYKNVGKKIMVFAQVSGWVLLIAGVIVASNYLLNDRSRDNYIGWIALVTGVVNFISSWILYGFGQMVSDVSALREDAEKPAKATPIEELPEL